MPVNPALREEMLSNPIYRGNPLNDPQFQEQQGYNSYDLNNGQMITPRFGECTPITAFETVPGDRHMLHGNTLTILNQIDANVCSEINSYQDYFYVPLRVLFPNNYEKLIPNPTKGSDLPWKALPQFPLLYFFRSFVDRPNEIEIQTPDGDDIIVTTQLSSVGELESILNGTAAENFLPGHQAVWFNQLTYVAWYFSRGQLLDYLGYCLELGSIYAGDDYDRLTNKLQTVIDNYFNAIVAMKPSLYVVPVELNDNSFSYPRDPAYSAPADSFRLDLFRSALYDAFEDGNFISILDPNGGDDQLSSEYIKAAMALYNAIMDITSIASLYPSLGDDTAEPFLGNGFANLSRFLAYQLSVAEYMTNDSVDNVFSAELYMQNLRAVMFPSRNGITREPTFEYNGVSTEYDYITSGAADAAFFPSLEYTDAAPFRMMRFASLMFNLRRSLRYGDYFSTGRPDLLAVGNLGIPVASEGGSSIVNPIDVTKNLLMQRYLNAANYTGPRFLNYMTSFHGVKPSSLPPHPIFLGHRKTPLQRNISTNTAQNQGYQTTNLLGKTDDIGFDVFIDDFGVIIGVNSFDALPVYTAGIDRNFHLADRFDYFNPMLQNVGDQEISLSELTGSPSSQGAPFAYTMRYANYKYGITKAHGAFVNDLPGYIMRYPIARMVADSAFSGLKIDPEFIRDKPLYFDQFFDQRTGLSPAQYYHFIVTVLNQHNAARKMQYQPPVLF